MTLEAAAVMGWFVVLVLGEKYVGDATAARRRAEDAVQQSSISSAMGYCEGSAPSGAPSSVHVRPNGKLSIAQIASILMGLGVGAEKTFPLYTEPFRGTFSDAASGGVTPHRLVGEGTHTFTGNRALACLERPKDTPVPSINQYRNSIFNSTVRGYGFNP